MYMKVEILASRKCRVYESINYASKKYMVYGLFFCGSFVLFMYCVCHALATVNCCLVVT